MPQHSLELVILKSKINRLSTCYVTLHEESRITEPFIPGKISRDFFYTRRMQDARLSCKRICVDTKSSFAPACYVSHDLHPSYKMVLMTQVRIPVLIELYSKISHGLHSAISDLAFHKNLALTTRKCT